MTAKTLSLIEELAGRTCERLTSRHGCLAEPGGYPREEWCDPCKARDELGRPKEAPRYCENCRATLVSVEASGGKWTGMDVDGSQHCPAPLHRPHLFYDEFTRKNVSR